MDFKSPLVRELNFSEPNHKHKSQSKHTKSQTKHHAHHAYHHHAHHAHHAYHHAHHAHDTTGKSVPSEETDTTSPATTTQWVIVTCGKRDKPEGALRATSLLERMEDNKILGGDLHKNLKRFEKNKNLEERLEGKRRKMGDLQPFASKQFLERMGDFNKNWERFENNRKLEMLEGKRRKMGDMQRLACQRLMCDQYSRLGHCKRGDRCPFLHGKPMKPLYRNISDNPELVAFMMKNGNMPACPPEDPTVKMLYVKRLSRTTLVEEDLRDCLSAYGDIESIRMVQEYNGAAFITYGTREAAEKCMEDLKTWVEIKGHKLKILWAYKYQPHRYTTISSNQQGAVTSTQEGASSSSSALEVKRRKIE